ncbi:transposase [Streptomyces sp. SM12]|uniref:IS701 family transposase n=1 Tax=Streptomyces sp. SM12 TaxID=1071602 RepID=UPI000CD556B7|nr:transposase [Streptomyces sp. SM12]
MGTGTVTVPRAPAVAYGDPLFAHLPRADQRRWAHTYLLGLLTAHGKKSVRSLAAAVTDSPTASQSLHQFINTSPWDWRPTRWELAAWAERRMEPLAWTVDVALLRKRGPHSCGVHRRFVPATGRSAVCQVGVGMFVTSVLGAVPTDWELLLPGPWETDAQRRRGVRVPDDVHAATVEQSVTTLIENVRESRGGRLLPVVADLSGCGDVGPVLRSLNRQGLDYMVAVPDSLRVLLGRRGLGGISAGIEVSAGSVSQLGADGFGADGFGAAAGAEAGAGAPRAVTVGRVGLPGLLPGRAETPHLLMVVRGGTGRGSGQLWLTSLADSTAEERAALLDTLGQTRQAVGRMAAEFGMGDFEGRSYPGWHRHMTMVSAAFAYSTLDSGGRRGG